MNFKKFPGERERVVRERVKERGRKGKEEMAEVTDEGREERRGKETFLLFLENKYENVKIKNSKMCFFLLSPLSPLSLTQVTGTT